MGKYLEYASWVLHIQIRSIRLGLTYIRSFMRPWEIFKQKRVYNFFFPCLCSLNILSDIALQGDKLYHDSFGCFKTTLQNLSINCYVSMD